MKKTYETPRAEAVKFDYTETVVASNTVTKQSAQKCSSGCGSSNPPTPWSRFGFFGCRF